MKGYAVKGCNYGLSTKLLMVVGAIVLVFAIQTNLRAVSESTPATTPTTIPTSIPTVVPLKTMVANNPTFAEMIAFLNSNKVNWQGYSANYDCADFACDLQREAYENGIRCAFVGIDYSVNGHAIVAFDTTDKGLIYIEPQLDLPVKVEVGTKYASWFRGPNYVIDHDDTVIGITLNWDLSFCDLALP